MSGVPTPVHAQVRMSVRACKKMQYSVSGSPMWYLLDHVEVKQPENPPAVYSPATKRTFTIRKITRLKKDRIHQTDSMSAFLGTKIIQCQAWVVTLKKTSQ